MTCDEAMKLAEEVFDEEYSGLDKDSFLIGFREAYNALTTLYKDKFELVKRMREAQIEKDESDQGYRAIPHICILEKKDRLESEVDEYLMKIND